MRTFCLTTLNVVFLILCINGIQAQTTQTKLNQVELMKQFLGNWKTELGKDTVGALICESFYNGFDFYYKIETKGKILFEEKTLSGYEKKSDRLFKVAVFNSSPEFMLLTLWFTLPNVCEEILYKDVANPDKANNKWIFEFKSPDLLTWTDFVNNKPTNIYTFHREK